MSALAHSDEWMTDEGYIRVFQDIRGKYGSEGKFVMTRPVRGPLNPTKTDETTDAWDTIDWMVKNVPESNGRVGMVGSSYEGYTVVMALLDPHPALKVAAPESPMIDGWMGDDWFHYGAFRQNNLDYITGESSVRGDGDDVPREVYDDYDGFLRAGSVDDYAKAHGLEQYPYYQRELKHLAYDEFWQGQALDKLVVQHPSSVPTMWEQGLFDQEDMWGAIHSWTALKQAGHEDNNYLVIGPWRHSGANYDGTTLGELKFNGDTALQWRLDRAQALLRSLSEGRAQARYAPRDDLQCRRKSLGPVPAMAAGLRPGLRRAAETALYGGEHRPVLHRADGRFGFLYLRSRQAGALSAAPGALLRHAALAIMAHHRPAALRQPAGRAGVPDRCA